MITCVGLQSIETDIEVNVTPEVRTYTIVSGFMSDDCQPYRIAQGAMLWLHQEGFLGELECIFSRIVEEPLCVYMKDIRLEEGFPQWFINAYDNIDVIQPLTHGFVLWLAEGKVITRHIRYKHLRFFLSENELVAIKVHQVSMLLH